MKEIYTTIYPMTHIDFPMLLRTSVGFDRLAQLLHESILTDHINTFPPYNIERQGTDLYRITLAVPGFSIDALEVTLEQEMLIIKGKILKQTQVNTYIYQGIHHGPFKKVFPLAQDIEITDATLENGLLQILLMRKKHFDKEAISIHFSEPR